MTEERKQYFSEQITELKNILEEKKEFSVQKKNYGNNTAINRNGCSLQKGR